MREDKKSTRRPKPGRQAAEDLADRGAANRPRTSGDSQLVQRAVGSAKEGGREGLHFLYVRYAPEVLDCVARLVSDQSEAEEVTQDVFSELTRTIHGYEEREGPFGAWILRVAREAALGPGAATRSLPSH